MVLNPPWTEVALRLGLTVIACLVLGFNRSQHGKAAGMSTTLLVGLAASVAMIQVNLLLPTAGRQSDSFVMNDLMRLPLGILTGVGFIGAGAILRRSDMIRGVTTAATLWLATVIGLALGGGQTYLGLAATVLGLFALWGVKRFENLFRQEHIAHLSVELSQIGPGEAEIRRRLTEAGMSIRGSSILCEGLGARRRMEFEVTELRRPSNSAPPDFFHELERVEGVVRLRWRSFS
ncbi:MgtC/SapB family protein [Methylocystis sp. JAN1]|uniref:MgtC/SapB family protein n=1 Tax=Methylocystis sp. JAN1 TaxID=3397211 RepID=UPI003FA339E9